MYKQLLTVILLFTNLSLIAQNWNLIYSKEIEAEDFLFVRQYDKAAQKYKEALKLHPQSGNLLYKTGSTLMLTVNGKSEAQEYLEKAAEKVSASYDPRAIREEAAPPQALLLLGKVYQANNQFEKAISAYNKYKTFLKADDPMIKYADRQIEASRIAPMLMADAQGFKATNLGNTINNKNANINPVISGDGKTLAFTTLSNTGYDIFVSKKKGDTWERPKKITDDLRGGFLKTTALSYDGTWMYLVDDMSATSSIFDTFYEDGYWVRAKKLKKPITTKFNESHASLSPDGRTLYFTSDRPGGLGGLDIYKSTQDSKGRWGVPENLGSRINTEFNENTPFVTPDGKYLFFSSEGHNSMGGYDIFYIELAGSGKPINLGYPINTGDDNLFFLPENLNRGFMAMAGPENIGPQDIYQVDIIPLVNLIGNLASSDNQSLPGMGEAKVAFYNTESIEPIAQLNTSLAVNSFNKKLLPGDYRIEISAEGFENFASQVSISGNNREQDFRIELTPLPKEPEPMLAVVEEIKPQEQQSVKESPKQEEIKAEQPTPSREVTIPKETVTEEKPKVETQKPAPAQKPITEKAKPEPTPKQKAEPKPESKPKPKSPTSGLARSTLVAETPTEGTFTVQIMALLVPVKEERFSNITGLSIVQGDDGYYRYFVGSAETRAEASEIQRQLKAMGYKDAFIRRMQPATRNLATEDKKNEGEFTIQVFALKNPVDTNRFSNLPDLAFVEGDDSFYRYFTGNYQTYEQARNDLQRVVQLGYKGAFVRKR